jgi:hypothetical protein
MSVGPEKDQQARERETIVRFLRVWYAVCKNFKLYTPTHPTSAEACQKMLSVIQDVFADRLDVTIQHTDGMFVVDDFLFIEESLLFYELLKGIEENRMGSIVFLPGVTAQEVTELCLLLLRKPDERSQGYVSDHIRAPATLRSQDLERKKDGRVRRGTPLVAGTHVPGHSSSRSQLFVGGIVDCHEG